MIPLPLIGLFAAAFTLLGLAARKAYKGWRVTHPRTITPVVTTTAPVVPATPVAPTTPAENPWWKKVILWPVQIFWPVGQSAELKKNASSAVRSGIVGGALLTLLSVLYYVEGGHWPMLILMGIGWVLYVGLLLVILSKPAGRVPFVLVAVAFAAIIYWVVPSIISHWRPVPDHGRAIHKSFMDVEMKESLIGDYYRRKAWIGRNYPGPNNSGVVNYCRYFLSEFSDAAGGKWKLPLKPNDMRWCFELCKLGHDLLEDAPVLRGCQGDYAKGACNREQAIDAVITSYERDDRNALYGGSNGCDEDYGAFENVPDAP